MTEAERNGEALIFHSEAARAGLCAAASDILDTMCEGDVPNPEAAILNGSVEFAAQLWMQVSLEIGVPRLKAKRAFLKMAGIYAAKHAVQAKEPASPPTKGTPHDPE